jgi:hypothetical protein
MLFFLHNRSDEFYHLSGLRVLLNLLNSIMYREVQTTPSQTYQNIILHLDTHRVKKPAINSLSETLNSCLLWTSFTYQTLTPLQSFLQQSYHC